MIRSLKKHLTKKEIIIPEVDVDPLLSDHVTADEVCKLVRKV